MKPIVEVKGLSKKYRLGDSQPYFTLRDTFAGIFRNPISAVKSQLTLDKDEFWALKDINFEVNQGEVVGIIGRNGAGKSTLLKVLSQITPPTEGEVLLRGRVGSLLEVGTGFSPELTGRENIYLNGAILGMKKAEVKKKFDEIVAFSEVEKFLDTPLKHYSSGMYMRLAFSVAAHLEPEILIVDEVLAVGDAEFQKKCLGKMQEVAGQGRTILFVSHNLRVVENLCKRCVLLSNAKIAYFGETSKCIKFYSREIQLKLQHIWKNNISQNKTLQLKSAWLDSDSNNQNKNFTNLTKIKICLELLIRRLSRNYVIHINLSKNSQIIFSFPIFLDQSFRLGINRIYAVIPDNFLNIGTYEISVDASDYCKENIFYYSSILSFQITWDAAFPKPLVDNHNGLILPNLKVIVE